MGELVPLPRPRSRWFADERQRSLRASWHPEADVVVLSIWERDRCVATFRLAAPEAPGLMATLADAVKAWAEGPASEAGERSRP